MSTRSSDQTGKPHDGIGWTVSSTESSEAGRAEDRLDAGGAGAAEPRVPTWVWVVLGALVLALVAVTLGLFAEARDSSANAEAASAEATQLMDDLVAGVQTTNNELKTFNEQFESALTSAEAAGASASAKKQAKPSSSGDESP